MSLNEKWKRLQELKRRNEEFKETLKDIDAGGGGDEKNEGNDSITEVTVEGNDKSNKNNKNKKRKVEHISSTSLSTSSPSPKKTYKNIKNLPCISPTLPIPKSITKYLNLNLQLKGTDHGRLAHKGPLEKELDKAVENGDLDLANKINDQITKRNFDNMIREAIECKEYDERRKKEEEDKAKKKKPKLKWGFETKQRWETKSNM
ncbi:hypothetical protein Glove_329g54 [Diversispora epigaea]|uniref:Uncharacterized protein n=1 Tax=Diversispora epigaea TaxID=1348612 RepID=A0A397HK58_9GLOM|nr:hypothetical protein Glove_329g54 [Diversispora epigaea]